MNEYLTIEKRTGQILEIEYTKQEWIDIKAFPDQEFQELLLPVRAGRKQGSFRFGIEGLISVEEYLGTTVLEKNEAFGFLASLFDALCEYGLNTPIVLHEKAIYLNTEDGTFRFAALPLCLDAWMERREDLCSFLQFLLDHMQIKQGYEIRGFLWSLINDQSLSLEQLTDRLQETWQLYAPRRLFGRYVPLNPVFPIPADAAFRYFNETEDESHLREGEFYSGWLQPELQEETAEYRADQHQAQELSGKVSGMVQSAGATQILRPDFDEQSGTLEIAQKRYPLRFETVSIGRHVSCDIVLDDACVSSKHARITCMQDRYYLQDLKSANGTWLNGKEVIRKMRLKEGMVVRFGTTEAVFHE